MISPTSPSGFTDSITRQVSAQACTLFSLTVVSCRPGSRDAQASKQVKVTFASSGLIDLRLTTCCKPALWPGRFMLKIPIYYCCKFDIPARKSFRNCYPIVPAVCGWVIEIVQDHASQSTFRAVSQSTERLPVDPTAGRVTPHDLTKHAEEVWRRPQRS